MFQTHVPLQFRASRSTQYFFAALRRMSLLLLLASPTLSGAPVVETPLSLRVRIYDYESLSPKTLEAAKAAAASILDQAGVRISWEQCRVRPEESNVDASCDIRLSPADIQLRIVGAGMAKGVGTSRKCLGYAWLTPGASIAGVYHHRVIEMERRNLVDRARALGAVMAHEIGHLLLQAQEHSSNGIMQGKWGDREMRQIAIGRLVFSSSEARRIQEQVRRSGQI